MTDCQTLAPERAPALRRVALAWAAFTGGGDPLKPVIAAHPELQVDADLWRMERDSLLPLAVEIPRPVGAETPRPAPGRKP